MQALSRVHGRGARLVHDCDPWRRFDGLLQAATPRDRRLLLLRISDEHAIKGEGVAPRLQPGKHSTLMTLWCTVRFYVEAQRFVIVSVHAGMHSQTVERGAQVSDELLEHVHDCYIMHEYLGSDHCPCGIIIKR